MLLLGRDVDKHQGLAVAAQAVLQEVSQLGVSVGNMRVLLSQGHDHVAEVGKRLVYVLGLGQPQSFAPAVLYSLTSGKINLEKILLMKRNPVSK